MGPIPPRRVRPAVYLAVACGLLAGAVAGQGAAQTPPQLVFTTDYDDAAIYIDGSLACRKQCAIQEGAAGTRYTVTCKLLGYHDGVASGIFPADGTVVVKCPLEPQLDDIAVALPGAGGAPPPVPAVALTPAIIDAVVVSSPGLQACFTEAEGRGEIHAGKLWVRFWVTPDGSAGNARFETEGYDGTVIHDCVIQELAQLRFPPYAGSEGKSIKIPVVPGRLRFAADPGGKDGGTVVIPAEGSEASASATLAPAIVDATIRSNVTIAACLEDARKRGRHTSGELWLQFTVAPSGATSLARIESPARVDSTLESCVTEQVNQLWFPSSPSSSSQLVMVRFGAE